MNDEFIKNNESENDNNAETPIPSPDSPTPAETNTEPSISEGNNEAPATDITTDGYGDNSSASDTPDVAEKPQQNANTYEFNQAGSSINMQFRRRKTPSWIIVLICVVGALYLIISATLIVTFFTFSKNHSALSPNTSMQNIITEPELKEHLQITESPKSEGAKTTDGALTVKQISEKVRASVVGVTCQSSSNFSSSSVGSGIIMSEDGYIITNNHVIEGMTTIQVVLDDGNTYDARLIGSDSRSDLAVIKINATGLKAAEFGDSDMLEQGDPAIAIGNPAGLQLQNTVTYGIISAINRDIVVEDRTMTLIQTDASINPGNSGGPLVNEFGQVIGINTIKVGIAYYEGLGFAIPMNTAKPIIDELISRGYVKGRPSIGITGTTLTERDSAFYGLPAGLYIEYVHPYSDAFKKGIRRGDIITKMNGTTLSSTAEIKKIRDNFTAGDTVTLTIYRNSEEVDIDVILMDEATLSNSTSEPS